MVLTAYMLQGKGCKHLYKKKKYIGALDQPSLPKNKNIKTIHLTTVHDL